MARFTVTVDDNQVESIGDIVDRLRSEGAHIESVHAELGMITVSTDTMAASEIEAIDGVASATLDAEYQLPPPESPIQ